MHARPTAATLLALCAAACGDGPGAPVGPPTAAVATRSCGPTDGAAVTLYLASSVEAARALRPPYVSVSVWQAPGDLAGRTWVLTGGSDGGALRHTTATEFEVATRGAVTVRRVAADTTIEGAVNLTFPSGVHVRQAFRAAWHAGQRPLALCG